MLLPLDRLDEELKLLPLDRLDEELKLLPLDRLDVELRLLLRVELNVELLNIELLGVLLALLIADTLDNDTDDELLEHPPLINTLMSHTDGNAFMTLRLRLFANFS